MTKFFNVLANIFFPLRYLLVLICFISLFSIVYLLIFSSIKTQELYLTTCLLVSLWGLLLFVLCHSYHGDLSDRNASKLSAKGNLGWFRRLKLKLVKMFLWVYSLLFIILIAISMHFSFKILTL
jgi:hypothetical protein